MRLGSILFVVSVATAAASAPARADIAPPDACTSPGQPCTNVMTSQAGICTATTCTRTVPDGDGGTTTMTYDCLRCIPPDGGGGGAGGTAAAGGAGGAEAAGGAGGATKGSGGASPTPPKKDGGGCSIGPGAGSRDTPVAAVATIGLLALVRLRIARRRSRGSR